MLSSFIQRLMFVKQFSIDKGEISILGEREIMLHASAILELQEIDESKIYDAGKKSAMQDFAGIVEHAKVYKQMKNSFLKELATLGQKIGQSDEGTIKAIQELFNVFGLGEMVIENLDNKSSKAVIMIKESTLAGEWLRTKGKSKSTVCTLTAGIIAGMFSYIFGKDVDCREKQCRALGKEQCLFEVN